MLGGTSASEILGINENKLEAFCYPVNFSNTYDGEQEDQVLFSTEV